MVLRGGLGVACAVVMAACGGSTLSSSAGRDAGVREAGHEVGAVDAGRDVVAVAVDAGHEVGAVDAVVESAAREASAPDAAVDAVTHDAPVDAVHDAPREAARDADAPVDSAFDAMVLDASHDAAIDGPHDAPHDTPRESSEDATHDAHVDAPHDAADAARVLKSVSITPTLVAIYPFCDPYALYAIATYSDGSTVDVTTEAAWTSSIPSAVIVDASTGLITVGGTLHGPPSVVTASFQGLSGSTEVTVDAPTPALITVSPPSASIAVGSTQAFTAQVTFADGFSCIANNAATWTSSATTVATISSVGVATGVTSGSSNITAALAGRVATATLTVQ
jgi:hypothetical protein